MKKIEPYLNINEATLSLDNGGRFYNFLTKADDGEITKGELGKVGGVFIDKQQMVLFLELSISKLNKKEKEAIISKLEGSLQSAYQKYKPHELLLSEAKERGLISSSAMLRGIPTLTKSNPDFNGFIMMPMVTNDVTTFMFIPLIDLYDVYELKEEESSDTFLIAHLKSSEKLPEKKIKVAGVFKELNANKEEKTASGKFLEALYYLDIN
ncbi:MAG: hypothetical protein ACI8P3_001106 [Saprospiraceae bacterium]|jgi:hypothetical protein